ncbi:phage holin family protein [Candidatus Azambacteria bacterium]|nr:phage holin family protein [Candidatus Azambacteria bacterium]
MIIGFLFRIVANALAILAAARFIPGVAYQYQFLSLLKIAAILALANVLLKPILKIIFSPLIFITLGFFTIVINIFILWLAVYFAPELSITGLAAYFLTTIVIILFNFITSVFIHNKNNKEND